MEVFEHSNAAQGLTLDDFVKLGQVKITSKKKKEQPPKQEVKQVTPPPAEEPPVEQPTGKAQAAVSKSVVKSLFRRA